MSNAEMLQDKLNKRIESRKRRNPAFRNFTIKSTKDAATYQAESFMYEAIVNKKDRRKFKRDIRNK